MYQLISSSKQIEKKNYQKRFWQSVAITDLDNTRIDKFQIIFVMNESYQVTQENQILNSL